jgi:hypothetical protein
MLYNVLSFVSGLIVMDFLWAWKLGIPQSLYRKYLKNKQYD